MPPRGNVVTVHHVENQAGAEFQLFFSKESIIIFQQIFKTTLSKSIFL